MERDATDSISTTQSKKDYLGQCGGVGAGLGFEEGRWDIRRSSSLNPDGHWVSA